MLLRTLKKIVYELALPEGRMVGTEGHDRARKYLTGKMKKYGFAPYRGKSFELPYKEGRTSFCNIVGVVRGQNPKKKPVLIGAHYDSVIAAPCADDNAAAVAIALEAGRLLQKKPPERDTIIAIFDAEEPPHFCGSSMGSVRFYHDQMKKGGIHAALVMDLVGHDVQVPVGMLMDRMPELKKRLPFGRNSGIPIPHLRNLLFITGAESHPAMEAVCSNVGRSMLLPTLYTLNQHVGDMSDHGVFRENGVPYLFLSCGRWQHYHQASDTPDKLSYVKMARITGYVEALIRSMGTAKLTNGQPVVCDTAKLEIQSLKRTFGPALPLVLRSLGLERLNGRGDLDALANALLGLGL